MGNGKGRAGVKKGTINNPKGRGKGVLNKDMKPIREKFDQLLSSYTVEAMIEDLKTLEANDRLKIVIGLAEFIVPKLQRTTVDSDSGELIIKLIRE